MVISRRAVLQSAAILALAREAAGGTRAATANETLAHCVGIVESALDLDGRISATWSREGAAVYETGTDVSKLWESVLRPLWAAGDSTVIGATSLRSAFCVDVLARDAGHALVHVSSHAADPSFRQALVLARTRVELSDLRRSHEAEAPIFWIIRRRM